jgi:hypothetical protein
MAGDRPRGDKHVTLNGDSLPWSPSKITIRRSDPPVDPRVPRGRRIPIPAAITPDIGR